jgi:hypothetical protein
MRRNLGLLHFTFLLRAEGSMVAPTLRAFQLDNIQHKQLERINNMTSQFDNSKVNKIDFDGDSRVQWRKANLNGRNYGIYILSCDLSTPTYIDTDCGI